MIDDPYGSESPATASPRRVSAYVGIPIVLACGLVGYALSVALPLHLGSATATPADAVSTEAAPARASLPETPKIDSQSAAPADAPALVPPRTPPLEAPARLGKPEPTSAPTPPPTPAAGVETGSVLLVPERAPTPAPVEKALDKVAAAPAAEKSEPARTDTAEPSRNLARAREARHKKIRRFRYYARRQTTTKLVGPLEALFPALVK